MAAVQIKICGLTTPETLDAAVAAGATHIGLNLHPPSPRYVPLDQAAALRRKTPAHVTVVLLLVNRTPEDTLEAIAAVKPDVVQFHGDEAPQWLAAVRQHQQVAVWKAFGVRDAGAFTRALKYREAADLVLFDAPAGALPGGNGLAIDWSLFAGLRFAMPWGLAGGLNPGNVAEAIRLTGAPLVDTSSGVETAPGVKDAGLIAAFCEAVRSA